MLAEVQQAINALLTPTVQMMASAVVILFILILLIAVDPLLAVIAMGVRGLAYSGVPGLTRPILERIGQERVDAQKRRHRLAHEPLAGMKEITLMGKEQAFLSRYSVPSQRYARHMATHQAIESMPRYALETIAFGSALLIVLYLLVVGRDVAPLLPILGLFALASDRWLPALQQVFRSAVTMRFNAATLDLLFASVKPGSPRTKVDRKKLAALPFRRSIKLRDMTYT